MSFKLKAKYFYITVILFLIVTTLAALYDGGYHIAGGAVAGIALASIITSLLPFFISMHLFQKYKLSSNEKNYYKVWGLIFYFFCFPIKSWIIYSNLVLLITGGEGWSFG